MLVVVEEDWMLVVGVALAAGQGTGAGTGIGPGTTAGREVEAEEEEAGSPIGRGSKELVVVEVVEGDMVVVGSAWEAEEKVC